MYGETHTSHDIVRATTTTSAISLKSLNSSVGRGCALAASHHWLNAPDAMVGVPAVARITSSEHGNLDTIRAPRSWQLVVPRLGRLRSKGWETTTGKCLRILRSWLDSGYTPMRQSTAPPQNYAHFLREGGLGHVPFASGSHLSVSASTKEHRKTGPWEVTS